MEIIWPAIILYCIGLGIVLYLRPALMFHENGTWKEFGYNRDSRHTIFPFWLFAIAWALVSYAIASAITWSFLGAAVIYHESYSDSESELESTPVEPPKATQKPRSGYYVLNSDTRRDGLRKYVYYGPDRPKP